MRAPGRVAALMQALGLEELLGPQGGVAATAREEGGVVSVDVEACMDRVLAAGAVDEEEAARRICSVLGACGVTPQLVRERAAARLDGARRLAELQAGPQGRGVAQRTPEWYAARRDMITASDIAQALGCGKFGTQRQFFEKKCGPEPAADAWAALSASVPALRWGVMFEPVAAGLYARQNGGAELHEFGLLRHPDAEAAGFLGASPDGITGAGVMVEIKCPWRRRINGEVPVQYYLQILGQLAVCGLRECDYYECEFQAVAGPEDPAWADAAPEARGLVLEVAAAAEGGGAYLYPEDGRMPAGGWGAAALRAWAAAQGAPGALETWWVLRRASLVRVSRDDAVCARVLERLREVWATVCRYRADPAAYEREVARAGPEPAEAAGAPSAARGGRGAGAGARSSPWAGPARGGGACPALSAYAFVEEEDEAAPAV